MTCRFLRAAFALLAAASAVAAWGAAYSTRNGGAWSTASNWSTAGCGGVAAGTPPGPADTVTICNGHSIAMDSNRQVLSMTVNAGGALDIGANTLTLTSLVGTLFTRAGAFTAGTDSKVVMNSNAGVTLTSGAFTGANSFYNLELSPILTTTARTYTFGGGAVNVNGNFDVLATDSTGGSQRLTVNLGAALTVAGTTTLRALGTAPGLATLDTTAANHALTMGRIDVGANTIFRARASTVTLNATSGTLFTLNGTFTANTSTVVMSSDADVTLTSGAIAFSALQLRPGMTAPRAYTFGPEAITVAADMLVDPGNVTGAQALTVNLGAGGLDVNGTLTVQAPADETSHLTTTGSNHPLACNTLVVGSGGTVSANGSALTIGQIQINAGGTMLAGSSTITLTGANPLFRLEDDTATFTAGTSRLVVAQNASRTIFATTSASSLALYDLEFSPTLVNNGRAYTMGALPLTINGNFHIRPQDDTGASHSLTVNMGAAITVAGKLTIEGLGTAPATALLSTTAADHALSAGQLEILSNGTLAPNDSVLTLTGATGPLFKRTGTFSIGLGTSRVVMQSTASVTLNEGAITFRQLEINMPGLTGTLSPSTSEPLTVQTTFRLTAGTLATGPNKVSLASAGTVVRTGGSTPAAASDANHVLGNFERTWVASAGTFVYPVGDGQHYTPISVTFNIGAGAGNFTASTPAAAAADHPDTVAGRSGIAPGNSVNRYWTLKNSTKTGTYNVRLYYVGVGTDVDAATTPAQVARGQGCATSGTTRTCNPWGQLAGSLSGNSIGTSTGILLVSGDTETDLAAGHSATARFIREKEFIYARELY